MTTIFSRPDKLGTLIGISHAPNNGGVLDSEAHFLMTRDEFLELAGKVASVALELTEETERELETRNYRPVMPECSSGKPPESDSGVRAPASSVITGKDVL
jgi:hypothetical protein